MDAPLVICVTPFFGRVSLFANVLGCFESQDYTNAVLLVSNDTGIDLQVESKARVDVINHRNRFGTLGEKRNYMRDQAIAMGAKYIAHWDDDDFYMPTFLSQGVNQMEVSNSLACRPCPVGIGTNDAPINNNLWDPGHVRIRLDSCQQIPYDSFFMMSAEPYAKYDNIGCGENLTFRSVAEAQGRWSIYNPGIPNCCYGWFNQIPHATNMKAGFTAGAGELWSLGAEAVRVASPENFDQIRENVLQLLKIGAPVTYLPQTHRRLTSLHPNVRSRRQW